jgi:hypothetical protein
MFDETINQCACVAAALTMVIVFCLSSVTLW